MNFAWTSIVLAALLILLPILPLTLVAFSWRSWPSTYTPSASRRRVTLAALIIGSISALSVPLLVFSRFLHPMPQPGRGLALDAAVLLGLISSLPGIALAACAIGKIRWLTLFACLISLTLSTLIALRF